MAVSAYILIQTEVGKAANVASQIKSIEGVTLADDVTGPYDVIVRAEAIAGIAGVVLAEDVTGPYDVIARVEANTVDELGKLVVAQVQNVAGITRTLTCPVVHL